jgi:hypothetical protein
MPGIVNGRVAVGLAAAASGLKAAATVASMDEKMIVHGKTERELRNR